MRIGIDLSLMDRRSDAPPSAPPQLSDPNVTAVGVDGWRATYTNPGIFDPEGDPRLVVVTRQGFDAQGQATEFPDPLVVMGRVREPYPNEATLTSSDVAMSDFVYAGEVTLGMTNNSTRPYPKPQALWLNHDLDVATTSTYRVRLAVAHQHARGGRPVAAVRFIASDGTNSTEVLSTQTEAISYAASGLSVPHFFADLDFSGLTPGALITIDAEIRPWIGEAFLISTDADPYPSVNLTVLKVLNDSTGSYGTCYAYIDAMSLFLVQRPQFYDVMVAENMYGDILSDLAAGLVGGMGMAPSGDIGDDNAVFQPSHGTAPDIAGQGKANPVATVLSAAMMLRWLGRRHNDPAAEAGAARIEKAVKTVMADDTMATPDLGGDKSTAEVGGAIAAAVKADG